MKKTFVLVVLFILPLVAYIFFASGVNNFGKLPTLTGNVDDVSTLDASVTLNDKITILGFLGRNAALKKGNAFNLNQKIYKRFYEFKDFQIVMVMPIGTDSVVQEIKNELNNLTDASNWKFIYAEDKDILNFYNSLETDVPLEGDMGTPYVFIIDKDKNLRGRKEDEDEGTKYGFNTSSVAELNNKMEDDVKIILAEYRLALKKNNAKRSD
ncbi:hypothetical protein [uncultured Muriicola sp.]|uniref:hypothetical protein n=1 Tax=uncultured Muriicola sp. TaxID=1583102 RepID=UPI002624B5F3|nr:hypothetical protein [uncultured Muriicola sp.]